MGLVILELQDHLDPLVLQVLKDLLAHQECQDQLVSQVSQDSPELMVCLVLRELQDHLVRKVNLVPQDLKAFLGILECEV